MEQTKEFLMEQQFLDVNKAADYLARNLKSTRGFVKASLRRKAGTGEIPAGKVHGVWYFPQAVLDQIVQQENAAFGDVISMQASYQRLKPNQIDQKMDQIRRGGVGS